MLCNRPTSQAKICHPIPKRSISIVNLQLTGTNVLKCKYVIGQQPTFDAAGQPLTAPVQELHSCLSSLFHFLSGNVFFSPDERLFDWEVKLLDWLVSTGHQDTKQEEVKCCSSWLSKTLLNSIIYHKIYYKNSVWGSSAAQRLNFRLGTWIVVWKQSNLNEIRTQNMWDIEISRLHERWKMQKKFVESPEEGAANIYPWSKQKTDLSAGVKTMKLFASEQ